MSTVESIRSMSEPVSRLSCRKCSMTFDVSLSDPFSSTECPSCGAPQTVPARLAHFLVTDLLGRGAFSSVYRAYDERLTRWVAIKVIEQLGEGGTAAMSGLQSESRLAAALNHRHIVQIYTVGEAAGHAYLVMELLDGGRLDERLATSARPSEADILRMALALADGLRAAHAQGLAHGALQPGTILFQRDGTPKISDFGLSRLKPAPAAGAGDPAAPYRAPERARGAAATFRSDFYSLGAILYHALAGAPPPPAAGDAPIEPLRAKRPDAAAETEAVVARLMDPDAAKRHPNHVSLIADLRKALAAAERAEAARPPPPSAARAQAAAAKKGPAVSPVAWVAAAVLVLALAGIGVWASRRPARGSAIPDTLPPPPDAAGGVAAGGAAPAPAAIQPFSPAEQAQIARFAAFLAAHRYDEASAAAVELSKGLPPGHGGRAWAALFYALPPWMQNQTKLAEDRLSPIDTAGFPSRADGSPHPGVMAQSLARVLLGRPFAAPAAAPGAAWPGWYDDLSLLFRGLAACRAASYEDGAARLAEYGSKTAADVTWPYAFQPAARDAADAVGRWTPLRASWKAEVDAGRGAAAVASMEDLLLKPEFAFLDADIRLAASQARALLQAAEKRHPRTPPPRTPPGATPAPASSDPVIAALERGDSSLEKDGLFVEAESADPSRAAAWELRDGADASGGRYLTWTGDRSTDIQAARAAFTCRFAAPREGGYTFYLRVHNLQVRSHALWARFDGADPAKSNIRVRKSGWSVVVFEHRPAWTWVPLRTSEKDPQKAVDTVVWLKPGPAEFTIADREVGMEVDRIYVRFP